MPTSSIGKRGFTLVELIVVVAIVSVLAGMIAPRVYNLSGSARLRGSSRRFLATVRYARDYAATRRCKCRLTIDTKEQAYTLTRQEDAEHDPNKFVPLEASLAKPQQLPDGLRFGSLRIEPSPSRPQDDAHADYIDFDPTGRADAAVIEITDGQGVYSILVMSYTGNAKLIEGLAKELPNNRLDLDE